MVAQEKTPRQLRPMQSPRRFRKTRAREVEQRQSGEERKIVHAGVKRGDQFCRHIEFFKGLLRVIIQSLFQKR